MITAALAAKDHESKKSFCNLSQARDYQIYDLAIIDFAEFLIYQKIMLNQMIKEKLKGALILCQHNPVITVGRSGNKKDLLTSETELKEKGIGVFSVERGGKLTYHGPGQLLLYPILNLSYFKKDIHYFLWWIEELIIHFLKIFSINGERCQGLSGVWVNKDKIASIGIAIRQWFTFHGACLNIGNESLENFRLIRPCGLDITMTSMEKVINQKIDYAEIKINILDTIRRFCDDKSLLTRIG